MFFFSVSVDLGINLRIYLCFLHLRKRVKPYCIKVKFITVVWLEQRVLDSKDLDLCVWMGDNSIAFTFFIGDVTIVFRRNQFQSFHIIRYG